MKYNVLTSLALAILPSSTQALYTFNESLFAEAQEFEYDSNVLEGDYYYPDERILGTTYFSEYNRYQNQPYVANGLIGSRIPNLGFGFTYDQNENVSSSYLSNGWPLFNERFSGAFIAGFFDAQKNTTGTNFPELLDNGGYESVISSIPQWTNFAIQANMTNGTLYALNPSLTNTSLLGDITNYNQELNMMTGTVTTSYTWLNMLNFTFTIMAHRDMETLGLVKLDIAGTGSWNQTKSISLSVGDLLDFDDAQRCYLVDNDYVSDNSTNTTAIYMVVQPENVVYKSAALYSVLMADDDSLKSTPQSTASAVSNSFSFNMTSSDSMEFYKYVGIVSDDYLETNTTTYQNGTDNVLEYAKNVTEYAISMGWDDLVKSHEDSWTELWGESRIQVVNNDFLTMAAESSLYHLLANTRPDATGVTAAVGVGGLSSDSYGGMVFWDADLWMLPGLLPFAPDHAVSIAAFRDYLFPQAEENAAEGGYSGAIYSWTAGRFGNCTGTGPCFNYEYHLNVAISYSIWKLYLAGAIDDAYLEDYGYPIIKGTADFFAEYVQYNETLGKYTTHNLTDPDEYANFKDNGAYTNAGISQLMKWATLLGNHLNLTDEVNSNWTDIQENMYLPVSSENITLEYTGMNSSISIKQADVVLITYPLDDEDDSLVDNFNYDLDRAQDDLTYYAIHQSSQGPAMTFPVFAAVANKLSDYGCGSQTYLFKAIEPFMRGPFAQLSEQNNDDFDTNGGTHPAFPFLTGNGGILQAFVYGLTNLRFSYRLDSNSSSIVPILKFDPVQLPLLSGDLLIDGIQYHNETLSIIIGAENATISSMGNSNNTIEIYVDSRNDMGNTTYHLAPGKNLTIPLYMTDFNMVGSLTECSSYTYPMSPGMFGDIADSIVDGDNATTWQATDKNVTTRLLIDLQNITEFSSGAIVWGDRLAANFSILYLDGIDELDDSVLETLVEYTSWYALDNTNSDYSNVTDSSVLAMDMSFAEYVSSELSMNISTAVNASTVSASSPWNPSNVDVEIVSLNTTEFTVSSNGSARYVILEVYGVLGDDNDEDNSGAEIAEFALFK